MMRVYYLFYDRQSQSGAFLVFSAGQVRLVEPVEYLFQIIFGDTYTGIFYGYEYRFVLLTRLKFDGRIGLAELYRIVYEIVKDLLDLSFVCRYKK